MAYEATSRTHAAARSRSRSDALRAALRTAVATRAVVWVVASLAALSLGSGGLGDRNAERFDTPALTHALGGVLAPLARWDAVWYLSIADTGYDGARAAFFPLYPLLVWMVGELGGGSRGALLLAAYALSLGTFVAALALLHRLVSLELGRALAGPTLLLLAVFPASLYFGAPYSESLFLLCAVGAFYAARTGRFAWAGAAAGAASATRSAGVLLLVPLTILWWQAGRRPRDGAWLLLAPLGLAAFAAYLALARGHGLAFLDVQDAWYRHFAGPLGGASDGLVAAVDGAKQLLSGSRDHVYFAPAGGDPFRVAQMNLMLFGFLVFALVATVGALRRLPLAYGAWVLAALLLPLSFPVTPQPLMSLPRFLSVLFPLFMWLAIVCEERRLTPYATAVSAVGLGWFVSQFAAWQFIS